MHGVWSRSVAASLYKFAHTRLKVGDASGHQQGSYSLYSTCVVKAVDGNESCLCACVMLAHHSGGTRYGSSKRPRLTSLGSLQVAAGGRAAGNHPASSSAAARRLPPGTSCGAPQDPGRCLLTA
jgi:hypothetical protein